MKPSTSELRRKLILRERNWLIELCSSFHRKEELPTSLRLDSLSFPTLRISVASCLFDRLIHVTSVQKLWRNHRWPLTPPLPLFLSFICVCVLRKPTVKLLSRSLFLSLSAIFPLAQCMSAKRKRPVNQKQHVHMCTSRCFLQNSGFAETSSQP